MFCRFADVMADSDFQSFQAMDSGGNAADIAKMTRTLGTYGPVDARSPQARRRIAGDLRR